VAHIHATANNTIVSIATEKGEIITWASAGTSGYKGSKKSTPYAAGQAATKAAEKAVSVGIKSVKVIVNGIGQGKDSAIRNLQVAGLVISELEDATPMPHNGCKPPKKPR
jgi:small subunit ribosomal protein S11